jgi:hypothetical protein
VAEDLDFLELQDGRIYIPDELSKVLRLDRTTIARMLLDEPGVLRHGHATNRRRRQYFSLRIPGYVVKRVLARMQVPEHGRAHIRA